MSYSGTGLLCALTVGWTRCRNLCLEAKGAWLGK